MQELLKIGELTFAYERFGEQQAPAIMLIRGLGTQMIEWSPVLIDALCAAGLQVVIFDNRDVGCSSKLVIQYELKDMADDVVGLLDGLRIDRAHIFGISLGGMIAQLLGYHFPERIGCLFSVMSSSGDPDLPQASDEVRAKLTETAEGREAVIELNANARALFGSPGYPETAARRLEDAARAYDRCYCPEGVVRQMSAAIADGSRVSRLAEIRLPTLVIHGADDPLIPCACGEDTARRIADAEFQAIPGMGHNIPDALAPDIAQRVIDFIKRRG